MAATSPAKSQDKQAIEQALAGGHLTVLDTATGYHRSMYADCPTDGERSSVRRIVRGPMHAITDVIMHCPRCGNEFTPMVDEIYLH
jgi:hypothetical protein